MKFHFAPVQGHTDAPYRHYHHKVYGNDLTYYTPFIRLEEGKLRKRDIKDFTSSLNSEAINIPQIIFRDEKELVALVDLMKQQEVTRLDLNMGCPFPLQTGHGRGAATVANESLAKAVKKIITDNQDINFSVKIRLGMTAPDEWQVLLPYLNDTHISHLAVHPRVARQQYSGELYLDQ
ncbi:MAG: tRNA-dihydrouridine synthase, partial [Muribaculaceae bacterium]|nr:tRNA-dihydrouridine synthase [Muribaculaceae bacterium]